MGIQVLVVFVGLIIALSVGVLAGMLELSAPLLGWLAIGLVPLLWTLLYLTERVIGREIWHYTAPYPYGWMQVDTVIVFGRAHREILRAAETKPADLIVMGAQGRGGIGLAVFGSTTQQIVRGATCPVLTVRQPLQA